MAGPRLLLVGIDGASPSLLKRWTDSGDLPTLARLRQGGCFGPLRSVPNMMSPAAWTTIATGVDPGKHGIFHFFDRLPGTYRFRQSNASYRAAMPFWRLSSEAGLRTAVLNMPMSYPADPVNGIQVAGWLAPSARSHGFTHPPELASELSERFGGYPLHSDVQRLIARGSFGRARDRILGNLRKKDEIAQELLARERWDVMAVVFVETDPAQHYFWHLTDPSHPEHDASLLAEVGDVVLTAYREVDRILGGLLERLDDLTHLLIVSDHGAGINCRGPLFLPEMFDRLGWQTRHRGLCRRAVRSLFALADSRLPAPLKHRLAALLSRRATDSLGSLFLGDIIWERTRAYTFLQGGGAEPWINVRGREPEGIVEPGEEYRALCQEVREVLMAATDPHTGRPVIADVLRRDEIYHGPHLGFAPDMLIRWREDTGVLRGLRCAGVRATRPAAPSFQTGWHQPDGMLLAWGEGIRAGEITGAQARDITPTLLHLCGLPVPAYADGHVLEELFQADRFVGPVVIDDSASLEGGEGGGRAGDDEQRAVAERLRGLGYL